ncbi:MAG: EAL domain-containing protein [Oscillospiraceae bacterium]|nr:EAL domain-containing protein [Oscillospiraceae bacterium]
MNISENRSKILVVDDSFANRMLLYKIFSTDYDVEMAQNGLEALTKLRGTAGFSAVILDIIMPELDGYGVLRAMKEEKNLSNIPVVIVTASDDIDSQLKALDLGAVDVLIKPLNYQIVLHRVRNILLRNAAIKLEEQNRSYQKLLHQSEIDDVSGIYNSKAFCRKAGQLIRGNPDIKYVIVRWDIDRFKVFNDIYGIKEGDRLLARIGSLYQNNEENQRVCGRWEADHFVICMQYEKFQTSEIETSLRNLFSSYNTDFEFIVRFGIYVVDEPDLDVGLMCDRALLALRSIKGSYAKRSEYYNDSMRAALIEEQQIISEMKSALDDGQFIVYFQPQYNYATKQLHGAEALVRWKHPVRGLISPAKFIPVFEQNGFITQVDIYMWEQVCRYQRSWLDRGIKAVPVSVNVSRIDIYNHRLCMIITQLLEKYNLDVSLVRLEITESAYMDDARQLISVVDRLRSYGFYVEMDDFGSGYSSLNTLKEVPVDMLKLDMKFMDHDSSDDKSGSILSSVVRMAHMIKLPVIAEGVETKKQADYLKSIGCFYMQGYYFAKPMPADQYERVLCETSQELSVDKRFKDDIADAQQFLNASTQATLLFNSFVGGAAIVEYNGTTVEALRMNDKYYEVTGLTYEEYEKYGDVFFKGLDKENKKRLIEVLELAITSREESACELCCETLSVSENKKWLNVRVRLLAVNDERYIFYVAIDDISQRMNLIASNKKLTEKLSAVMDNVPGGIIDFEISDKMTITYFNDSAAEMFGYSKDEYELYFTASPLNVIHKDDMESCRKLIDKIVSGVTHELSFRYRHKCKNGQWKWVQLTGRIVRKDKGTVYISSIMLDIDSQIKSEENEAAQAAEIRRQKFVLQTLYDSVPCGITQYKFQGEKMSIASFNDASWRILGYSSRQHFIEEIHKKSKFKDIHPKDLGNMMTQIKKLISSHTNRSVDLEHRIIRVDGSIRWVHTVIQKVYYNNDNEYIQTVFQDITEFKKESIKLMSDSLLSVYDEVYECDVDQDICILCSSRKKQVQRESRIVRLSECLDFFRNNIVLPDDTKVLQDFTELMRLQNKTLNKTQEFRYIGSENEVKWASVAVIYAGGSTYLICQKDITEQKHTEELAVKNAVSYEQNKILEAEHERNSLFISKTGIVQFEYLCAADTMQIVRTGSSGRTDVCVTENYTKNLLENKAVSLCDRQLVQDAFLAASARCMCRTLEYRSDRFDNGYILCRLQLCSVSESKGKPDKIIGHITDIHNEVRQKVLADKLRNISESSSLMTGDDYDSTAIDDVISFLSDANDKEKAVSDILESIGRQLNVSRVYIIESDDDGVHCKNTFEWCNEGITPQISNLQNFEYPDEIHEQVKEYLDNNGVLNCADIEELPEWYRQVLSDQGVRSVLMCALKDGEGYCGYIGFDECSEKREWSAKQVHILMSVSQIIGFYLNRRRFRFVVTEKLISDFEKSPAYIYIVDPDTFEVLYMNPAVAGEIHTTLKNAECFRQILNDKPCSKCPIKMFKSNGFPVPVTVRVNSRVCIMVAFASIWNGKKVFVVYGTDQRSFFDDPCGQRIIEYQQDLVKYSHTLSCLYDEISLVDFEADKFITINTRHEPAGQAVTISEAVAFWSSKIGDEKQREEFISLVDLNQIQKSFSQHKAPILEYRVKVSDNSERWISSTMFQISPVKYLCCNKDITAHKNAEKMKVDLLILKSQKAAQDKYRVVVDQTNTAVFEMNYETKEFTCSDLYYKYEVSRRHHGQMPDHSQDRTLVHKDDQHLLDTFLNDIRSGEDYADTVIRIKMTDGTFRWTRIAGTFIKNSENKIIKAIGTFTDVEEEIRAKLQLEQTNERMKRIIDNIPAGVAILEIRDQVYPIFVSDKTCQMFGFTRQEYNIRIANGEPVNYFPPREDTGGKLPGEMNEDNPVVFDKIHARKKNSEQFWLRAICSFEKNKSGVMRCYCILHDITDEIKRQQNDRWLEERYRILSECSDIMTFDYSPQDDTMRRSVKLPDGTINDEIHNKYLEKFSLNKRISSESKEVFNTALLQACSAAVNGTHDFMADFGAGYRWYRAKYVSLADDNGEVYRVVGRIDDINDIMIKKDLMTSDCDIDRITGLRKKKSACELIRMTIAEKPADRFDAVLFIDIDNFSQINKSIGTYESDMILSRIGEILKSCFRSGDIVSHFESDEFIAYMPSVGNSYPAEVKARNIIRKINSVVMKNGDPVCTSIGITGIIGPDQSYDEIIRHAYSALKISKKNGKNTYTLYKEK